LTGGQPVDGQCPQRRDFGVLSAFEFMGQGYLFGVVPMQLVCFAAVAAVAWAILSYTISAFAFSRSAAAPRRRAYRASTSTGESPAFVLMGTLAAFAGILSLAFLPSGQAGRTGLGLELDVIAATIVGGASSPAAGGHDSRNHSWRIDHRASCATDSC